MDQNIETINNILKSNNGYITVNDCRRHFIPSVYLPRLVKTNKIEKVSDEVFKESGLPLDDAYVINLINNELCYSKRTALILNGLLDEKIETFQADLPEKTRFRVIYKLRHAYVPYYVYTTGQTLVKTEFGNYVLTYDKERSICELVLASSYFTDEEKRNVVKKYLSSEDKNLDKLIRYSEKLRIADEIKELIDIK